MIDKLLRRKPAVVILGVVLVAGLCASTLHIRQHRFRPYLHEALYLPSGKLVKELSLGYKTAVADLVWFSAIQYYGNFRLGNHALTYFKGLIDIIVTLDPHFTFAYIFGAMVVCEDLDAFDEGMEILKKGIANNPTSWELPFEIAFLNFVNRRDLEMSGRYFNLASRMPGAPEKAIRFAAFVYSKAGMANSSLKLWEEYRDYTDNPFLKELATRYIDKLKAELVEGTQQNG